jgi:hypothetical protein
MPNDVLPSILSEISDERWTGFGGNTVTVNTWLGFIKNI